jgi:futalosine hydrolase
VNRARRARRILLLIPTPFEAKLLTGLDFGSRVDGTGRGPKPVTLAGRRLVAATTGLGLAAAGANAARWLAQIRPDAAVLAGLCGTFDPERLAVGGLLEATQVACDGIGAGEGEEFAAAGEPPPPLRCAPARSRGVRGEVLSVAAAADGAAMTKARRRRHPRALAEEMEGYSVAIAARNIRVPLVILRGASNVAGERDHRRWKFEAALAACRDALAEWVATR